ncbi:MAG: elongation factor G [Candidatus Omnitrophica bacterium]|nr:elongation factor G [Candidatus Omnitrophota bacterium]
MSKECRNIVLTGHAGCGKTSLADTLIYHAGAVSRWGKVDEGNSIGDYDPEEITRKISINSKVLNCTHRQIHVNIIDTPGYADFIGDVISALRAVDSAIVVICAVNGVEVGSEKAWGYIEERAIPRAIFINRMEKENADFSRALSSIQNSFGQRCVALQYPSGKESGFSGPVNLLSAQGLGKLPPPEKTEAEALRKTLIEKVAELEDTFLEEYLDGKELTMEEIKAGLKKGIASCRIVPVFCGSAMLGSSATPLLDAAIDYFPAPKECPPVKGVNGQERLPVPEAPFSGLVFKTLTDPYVGQLTLFRVFSGKLSSNTAFYNSSINQTERIGQIYFLQGKEQEPVDSVSAGDIAAVAKLKNTHTGNSLCDEKSHITFDNITLPEPVISYSVRPKTRGDEEKISTALAKLSNEDPTFKISRDAQTKESLISGMGDLHLEIMVSRLKKKFGVDVEIDMPKVAYKETIKKMAQVQGKYKRQSGGRGQYGDVWLKIEPLPRGGNFEFVNKVVGGAVPRQYIPAVEKGVHDSMAEGVISGHQVVDVRVTIYDGSFHPVDSSEMAFKIAGSMAFKKGISEADPVLIEPVMEAEITVPDEYLGAITGDLNSRRGRIIGIEPRSGFQFIKASVPFAEMLKYSTELRSMTGGRGSFSMKFSHYEEVPHRVVQPILEQFKKEKEKEV